MTKVVTLKRFHLPNLAEATQFFANDSKDNLEFAKADLARSGLTPEDMRADYDPRIRRPERATAAYGIPYFDLDGKELVDQSGAYTYYRMRLRYPEYSKEQRYVQPSGDSLIRQGLPPHAPYIHPDFWSCAGDTVVCCEGEKKSLAVLKHMRVPAFGIGGCQLWRHPTEIGNVHPWIMQLLARRNSTTLTIVPDGDIFRYDICGAYGAFARALEANGITVSILVPTGKIDDLLLEWGEHRARHWDELKRITPNDLVQSPASLTRRYGIAFKTDAKERVHILQHSSNVMRLMEEHPAFPRVWRNADTNRVMLGDKPATPDLSEMEIANYFQHFLGFDKVGHKLVYSCIQAMAKKNSRSPMLEGIKATQWDNVPRLDTWLTRLWGVEDSAYTREVAAKWFISACARMDKPGVKIDWMLIVIGSQGVGKTSMPEIAFKGNSMTLYGEQNDKDLHMLLHSSLCAGFDELDSFGKRESSNLKAMITRREDMFRPPYGASVEAYPRRFVLYGCGNRHEFLQHDPSGYRRYAIVNVGKRKLNFREMEAEVDQIWAEAWDRYTHGGVSYWEIENASTEAERYVVPNPLEDQIRDWLYRQGEGKLGGVKDGVVWFTITGLLMGINQADAVRNPNFTREVAGILKAFDCEQVGGTNPCTGQRGRFYTWKIEK